MDINGDAPGTVRIVSICIEEEAGAWSITR